MCNMASKTINIKQIYVPYWEWEDWINGMWKKGDETRLREAIEFTGDHVIYGNAMKEVITAWPRTILNTLTNPSVNKRAFLGHCAVCFKLGIAESVTRMAWKHLTDQQRYDADKVAQETINDWLNDYRSKEIYKPVGNEVLF